MECLTEKKLQLIVKRFTLKIRSNFISILNIARIQRISNENFQELVPKADKKSSFLKFEVIFFK
jgi:hypothetical protein